MKSGFTGNYATLSKLGRVVAAALLFACTSDARAGFVPVGVQNDVSFDTVVNNWAGRDPQRAAGLKAPLL